MSNAPTLVAAKTLPAARNSDDGGTVMMVDDEKLNSFVVAEYLKLGGYRDLVHTTDPLNAIALATRVRPDVILLDIEMPLLNGVDLLRMIRNDPLLAETAVLVLSATVDDKMKAQLVALRISGILRKPIRKDDLLARLQLLVATRRTRSSDH